MELRYHRQFSQEQKPVSYFPLGVLVSSYRLFLPEHRFEPGLMSGCFQMEILKQDSCVDARQG